MTPTPSTVPAARPRWRSIIATFALVGALVASTSAMSAAAEVVGTGPGTISGTVTSADGQPIEGAYLYATSSAGASATTDATGYYEFVGLELEQLQVSVWVNGYQQALAQAATLTVESPTATINFVLAPFEVGVGTISGLVTGDGVPLAGQAINVFSYPTGQSFYTVSDENGNYEFTGLPNGTWNVSSFTGPEYQYPNIPSVEITDGAPNATVDIVFIGWPVGTSSISGVVTDSLTAEPLAGVTVSLYGYDVAHNSSVSTDETGAFSFDLLPAGNYSFNVWGVGYLHSFQDLTLLADESLTVDTALIVANSTISGHVKGKNGAPLAGVFVDAHDAVGNIGGAETDANGDYVIDGVGASAYTLNIGGAGTPYKAKERVVTPPANGAVTANFTLKDRKTGSLVGSVWGPGGVTYTNLVCATLYSSKNKNPVSSILIDGDHYGEDAYFFGDLKPGAYTVEFEDCDADPTTNYDNVFLGGAKKYKDATFVTIAAAQDSYENSITLTFKTPTATISGHVAKPNGTPIAGLAVTATDGTSTVGAVTDANGDYSISGLYSGEYTVSVGGAGTLYVHKEKSVTAVEDGTVTANFNLAKK